MLFFLVAEADLPDCYEVSGCCKLHLTVFSLKWCTMLRDWNIIPLSFIMRMKQQTRLRNHGRVLRFMFRKKKPMALQTCLTCARESGKIWESKLVEQEGHEHCEESPHSTPWHAGHLLHDAYHFLEECPHSQFFFRPRSQGDIQAHQWSGDLEWKTCQLMANCFVV